ncbi:low temperature requirement protein A [Nocardioides sp. B-3]|nr:low temperature requirement protein A [Nocardioides sp. B-3]UUZ57758.1 low temperature requirement protein A [Nocardioides sp. B-3]
MTQDLTHRLTRMTGRDPHESHRTATPLELLYDLTFVIAFGLAADELAHALAADHPAVGLGGFAFAMFAVTRAWIQYTWFASAYDTDDWVCRLMVMVQMLGVVIPALGLPAMFASLEHGEHLDNRVMVLGYVVMRVPMVAMWLRAARASDTGSRAPHVYVVTIVCSQLIWCWIALADLSIRETLPVMIVPLLIELSGPAFGERLATEHRIPWHAHHLAERYGLLVIIALGEGLLGTVAAISAIVGPDGPGWTWDVAVIGFAGVAMTFGMWWIYFVLPNGDLLHRHRGRGLASGLHPLPDHGRARCGGCRPARRRLLRPAPQRARHLRDRADGGDPAVGVRPGRLRALHDPHVQLRSLPPAAPRRHRRGAGRGRADGARRRLARVVPARAVGDAVGDGRRLRDHRTPPQRGGPGRRLGSCTCHFVVLPLPCPIPGRSAGSG